MTHNPLESETIRDAILKNLLQGLSRQLLTEGFISRKLRGRTASGAGSKTELSPNLTVIDFSAAMADAPGEPADSKVAIVVRSPEMGSEASLVRPFLRGIVKSLTHLNPADRDAVTDITLYMVAAGGSCDVGPPGEEWTIDSSVYVGPRIERVSDESSAVYASVEFVSIDPDSSADDEYRVLYKKYFGNLTGNENQNKTVMNKARGEAQQQIWRILYARNNPTVIEAEPRNITFTGGPHEALKAFCRTQDQQRKTSLTGGFFLYSADKEVAHNLGLHDVNMEDFHILRIVRSLRSEMRLDAERITRKYPNLTDFVVKRIDADPYRIEDLGKFNTWFNATGKDITFGDMRNLIKFGLDGLPFDTITGENRANYGYINWGFVLELAADTIGEAEGADPWQDVPQELDARFVYWRGSLDHPLNLERGNIFIPDAIRIEVATDLLKDAKRMKAVTLPEGDENKARLVQVMSECASQLLNQGAAGDVSGVVTTVTQFGVLANICQAQTTQLGRLSNEQEASVESLIKIFVSAYFKFFNKDGSGGGGTFVDDADSAPLWLRSKWGKVIGQAVQWTPDNIDRLYYKASNMAALKRLNDQHVRGLVFWML